MTREAWIKRLLSVADKHQGLVSLGLAAEAHLSRRHLSAATRLGIVERVLPRVYRVIGSPRSRLQVIAAAQLWASPEAAVSHWTAAELHALDVPQHEQVHITATRYVESASPDIFVHPRAFLPDSDLCRMRGLAATGSMRTLIDLAALARPYVWESALDTFLRRGMDLESFVDRFETTARQGRNGTRLIRSALVERASEAGLPEQLFERRLLSILREWGLPLPVAQFWVTLGDGQRVRLDFAYPSAMVAIEAQSFGWHSDRQAWERDRVRISELSSLGWRVIEVTWRQLDEAPDKLASRVARALGCARS